MVLYVVLFTVVLTVIARWSRREGWSQAHRLALAGGALLTYAWHSFPWRTIDPASLAVDLAGNVVFTAGAVVLLVVAALGCAGVTVRHPPDRQEEGEGAAVPASRRTSL
ncbi:hypothetical protein ACFQYP_18280 [Nonomuraea antimicrobica]